jgi:hypothetical protein
VSSEIGASGQHSLVQPVSYIFQRFIASTARAKACGPVPNRPL